VKILKVVKKIIQGDFKVVLSLPMVIVLKNLVDFSKREA
jgi:hypothetical protein